MFSVDECNATSNSERCNFVCWALLCSAQTHMHIYVSMDVYPSWDHRLRSHSHARHKTRCSLYSLYMSVVGDLIYMKAVAQMQSTLKIWAIATSITSMPFDVAAFVQFVALIKCHGEQPARDGMCAYACLSQIPTCHRRNKRTRFVILAFGKTLPKWIETIFLFSLGMQRTAVRHAMCGCTAV